MFHGLAQEGSSMFSCNVAARGANAIQASDAICKRLQRINHDIHTGGGAEGTVRSDRANVMVYIGPKSKTGSERLSRIILQRDDLDSASWFGKSALHIRTAARLCRQGRSLIGPRRLGSAELCTQSNSG